MADQAEGGEARRRSATLVIAALALVAVIATVAALVVYAGSDDDTASTEPTDSTTEAVTTLETDATTTTAAGSGGVPVEGLGTVTVLGTPETCPTEECVEVEVQCSGLPPLGAIVATEPARGQPAGVVVAFSGGLGTTYWANPDQGRQARVVGDIARAGFETVEVAWQGDGWGVSPPGDEIGFATLACRPATITKWLHQERYLPLELDPPTGQCGFCATGNSGGASQIAYGLELYGLDEILDAAILTSGPPHANIVGGCLGGPADAPFAFGLASLPAIDGAYGHLDDPGPCAQSDEGLRDLFTSDGLATGEGEYVHDSTRIEMILGSQDRTVAPAHARLYYDRLSAAGTPMLNLTELPEMEHEVLGSAESRDAVVAAIANSEQG